MASPKKNWKKNSLFILALVAVIGIMSWNEMHPKDLKETAPSKTKAAGYLIKDPTTLPEMVPDDSRPITIQQGTFECTPEGRPVLKSAGMQPTLFPQRQINLQFGFDCLPKASVETFLKIAEVIKAWKNEGNIMAAIVMDYRPAEPDFNAYAKFIQTIRKDRSFVEDPHIFIAIADPSWLDNDKTTEPILGDVATMMFDVAPDVPPDMLKKLNNFQFRFFARLPDGTLIADVAPGIFKDAAGFMGYILTVDPRAPLPEEEEEIGVLPKFMRK